MRRNRLDNLSGFTLVELLVVVAIVAVLAAVIFPVMNAARERARQTKCFNNMKQLGIAVRLYAEDWDGTFPCNRFQRSIPSNRNWKHAIRRYVRSMDVYICPSNDSYFHPLARRGPMDETGDFPISYGYNGAIFQGAGYDFIGRKISTIVESSRTIYMLETRGRWPDVGPWWLEFDQAQSNYNELAYPGRGKGQYQVHNGRLANWLFCDLHVSALTIPQTCVPRNLWGTASLKGVQQEWASQPYYDELVYQKKLAPEYNEPGG
jgi:prepilin-type N-terminal cleavage/methylation domain-containing protein/prepilin-type processing-associated H-X9-DG protein